MRFTSHKGASLSTKMIGRGVPLPIEARLLERCCPRYPRSPPEAKCRAKQDVTPVGDMGPVAVAVSVSGCLLLRCGAPFCLQSAQVRARAPLPSFRFPQFQAQPCGRFSSLPSFNQVWDLLI